MKVRTDDDVYRYRGVFLGPRGKTLPWQARYLAYGLFLPQFPLYGILFAALGLPAVTSLILGVGAAVAATMAIMWIVDHDRPLRSWLQVVRAELDTPAPPRPARAVTVVRAFTVRSGR